MKNKIMDRTEILRGIKNYLNHLLLTSKELMIVTGNDVVKLKEIVRIAVHNPSAGRYYDEKPYTPTVYLNNGNKVGMYMCKARDEIDAYFKLVEFLEEETEIEFDSDYKSKLVKACEDEQQRRYYRY